MSKKIAALAALGLIGAAVAPAMAVEQTEKWEITLLGSGSNDVDFDGGSFVVNGSVGYYFNDQWQAAVRQSFGYSDTGGSDSDSSWTGTTRVGAFYHFNYAADQRIVPYLGVNVGYIYGDQTADSFIAGPEAGVKWFVNDTTFLYGSVAYEFLFEEADDADSSFDDGQFVYGLGIGFQF
jgi:hypothetical protein